MLRSWEVETETYAVTIKRYIVVEDCGRIINPLIVDGQVRGGVAQGIGAALYEEVVYNDEGQLLTGSLVDYLVPTASELLPIEVHHIETPSPTTLGGFRGMGEGGTIGAPAAIANAVSRRTVSPRHRDQRDSDYPGETVSAGAGDAGDPLKLGPRRLLTHVRVIPLGQPAGQRRARIAV